ADKQIRRLNDLPNVPAEQDLMVRAAHLLADNIDTAYGVDIFIQKKLPMGGGLGGGSSDAATILHGLNVLWQADLSTEQLADLALQLGADVPIFVHGQTAWAEGIGEQVSFVDIPEPWYVVIHPPVSINTATIFAEKELTRDCKVITIADFLAGVENNVFEPLVRAKYPVVNQAMNWLSKFSKAKLTGSGSCIFASFADQASAQAVFQQLLQQYPQWRGFVAQGVNISPLQKMLGCV
ncbi:MAG TPA: 4-(cytidine 5'-diphospho)-2-C-methyl-D-erythritol kinase, partial [Thiothrix sp.]|nr:4-(cytidine 5'-diphospho)-2-C-methyl-D-erythritol kinase [Thiothrix sp.]